MDKLSKETLKIILHCLSARLDSLHRSHYQAGHDLSKEIKELELAIMEIGTFDW